MQIDTFLHQAHRFIYAICYHIPRDGHYDYVKEHIFSEQTKFSLSNDLSELTILLIKRI